MSVLARALCLLCLALAAGAPVAGARTVKPLPKGWEKGLNVAAFKWNSLNGKRADRWLERMRDSAHADHALFSVRWIQYWRDPLRGDDLNATDISPSPGSPRTCRNAPKDDYTRCQTPSPRALERALRRAKALGMSVGLRPLIDVGRDGRAQTDRRHVDFRDPEARTAWFDSYRAMIARYAGLARDVGADLLVIGTGLTKMTDSAEEQEEWRRLVQDVRTGDLMGDGRGGFDGRITYAARWDSLYKDAYTPDEPLFFWDELDAIAVEGFWPLVSGNDPDHDDPTVARLRRGWTYNYLPGGMPPGAALRALHEEYDRPVMLTGLGYLSRGGTAADPSKGDYAQAAVGGKPNERAQARPYRAAFDFWGRVARRGGWFTGIYWWNWQPELRSVKDNGDYTPQGKAAEVELCLRHLGRMSRSCRPSPVRR